MSGLLSAITSPTGDVVLVSKGGTGLYGLPAGGFVFSDIAAPEGMRWGGSQALAKQIQPGGNVFLNPLGVRYEPISWSGYLEGLLATATSAALNQLMLLAQPMLLVWFSHVYTVVISKFTCQDKFINWARYEITCEVQRDEAAAVISQGISALTSATSDLGTASGYGDGIATSESQALNQAAAGPIGTATSESQALNQAAAQFPIP